MTYSFILRPELIPKFLLWTSHVTHMALFIFQFPFCMAEERMRRLLKLQNKINKLVAHCVDFIGRPSN